MPPPYLAEAVLSKKRRHPTTGRMVAASRLDATILSTTTGCPLPIAQTLSVHLWLIPPTNFISKATAGLGLFSPARRLKLSRKSL